MSILKEVQRWYQSNCDGEWEHSEGIKISTIDNPGWRVEINLRATSLESKKFKEIKHNYGHDEDWYYCWTEKKKWNGAGSPENLEVILKTFLEWAEKRNK